MFKHLLLFSHSQDDWIYLWQEQFKMKNARTKNHDNYCILIFIIYVFL